MSVQFSLNYPKVRKSYLRKMVMIFGCARVSTSDSTCTCRPMPCRPTAVARSRRKKCPQWKSVRRFNIC